MRVRTQEDLVKEELGLEVSGTTVLKEEMKIPGVETLHLRPRDEIAEVLVNILKSRANIVGMKWEIGKSIEVWTKDS